MSELRQAIQKHLGITVEGESVSYYQLLGIPADARVEAINNALKVAADRWNQSDRKSNPEAAKKVAALIKEAQSVLLNADLRRNYDLSLMKQPGSTREAEAATGRRSGNGVEKAETKRSTAEASTATIDKLDDWDDSIAWDAPFDATLTFPEYDTRDYGTAESRWAALASATSIDTFLRSTNTASLNPTAFTTSPASTNPPSLPTRHPATGSPKSNPAGASMDRAAMLRKKRQRQQILLASGLVGTAFLFLGAAGVYFYSNQLKLAQAEAEAENDGPKTPPSSANANDPFLPGIPPNDKEPGKQSAARPKDFRSSLPSISKDPGPDMESSGMESSGMASNDSMPPKDDTPPPDDGMTKKPDSAMETNAGMMSDDKEKEMMDPPSSMAKDPNWTEAMSKARAAIKKADFETFKTEIEKALPLSKSNEQENMYKRLDQVGQLYEIAVTAMKDARKSLRGTETLTVGAGKVNIVEVKEDGIIIRKDGDNITHAWNELPPGIAMAVSNFTLSETDPTDIAARAVYLSLSQTQNAFQEKTIQSLWEKSLGKGSIRQDLPQALKDTYE
ncbi:MAG: J domain-containing protein [Pirellula sp.]|nr:J domain-containing protein [Pirellula sp.]